MFPLVENIIKYKNVSIIGLEKNTGKTECLNHILKSLPKNNLKVAITSIGLDGEDTDQVTYSRKPEITLTEGIIFGTSEKHYKSRRLVSQVLAISDFTTALGRVVTAQTLIEGKVLLSGASDIKSLKRWIDSLCEYNVDLVLIDGALSRKSSASAQICQGLILATGASFSANIRDLVSKTAFAVQMIKLPLSDKSNTDIQISSFAGLDDLKFDGISTIGISGALTDRVLGLIMSNNKDIEVIVDDFTKVFVSQTMYGAFVKSKGRLTVRHRPELIAVCVNPVAPNGIILDSELLCSQLEKATGVPIYDIRRNEI